MKADTTIDDILTDRLIIRLAKPDDAEEIYSYRSDTIENQYQGWFPESVEEVRNYITNMPVSMDIADVCFQFAILTKKENRLIGDMGIIFTGHERMQAEIGCTLNKDFQGKGYATEALTAMINYFFLTLKKHRVVASIDPRNTASIRLIERLGFRKEAHFKESYYLRGEWVDDIIYAILETEWVNNVNSMVTMHPTSIALQFNECITNADLKGLSNLMTEDHEFWDTANNRTKGKDNNIVHAWEPFFNLYPGYRNIFENIVARDSTVIMQGYSICSGEILNNIRAIWVAEIINNKVGSWHIYPDTKENREIFDL